MVLYLERGVGKEGNTNLKYRKKALALIKEFKIRCLVEVW
jgi:hypothetical protein